jgi:hypothetical protein
MGRLRSGSWPAATADDMFQGLEWTLRRKSGAGCRPTDICELSCLDFPGEVYRKAFVETSERRSAEMQQKVEALWNYIERADSLIVLINLSDVIAHGLVDRRVHESIWVTSAILEQALKERPGRALPKTAIVLSQADNYWATLEECGSTEAVLEKYLPHVYNSYGWLDSLYAYTVDKTRLDDDGNVVPAPDFTTEGLRPIMDWLLSDDGLQKINEAPVPVQQLAQEGKQGKEIVSSKPGTVERDKVNLFVYSLTLIAALGSAVGCLASGHWGVAIFLGVLLLGLSGERGAKNAKQNAGPWLGCIPLLLLAGVLGTNGHWIWAAISGFMVFGVISRDSEAVK